MPNFENDGRYTIREIEIYLKAHRNLEDAIDFLSEESIEHVNYQYQQSQLENDFNENFDNYLY